MVGKGLHNTVPDECKRNPLWVRDRGHNDITDGRPYIAHQIYSTAQEFFGKS